MRALAIGPPVTATLCRSRELNYIVLSYRGTVNTNWAVENYSSPSTGRVNRIDIVLQAHFRFENVLSDFSVAGLTEQMTHQKPTVIAQLKSHR